MTPFASGTQSVDCQPMPTEPTFDDSYLAAYKAYAEKPVAAKYLLSKYGYASAAHEGRDQRPARQHWDADITAKVTYEFPFNVPGIGRIFGKRGDDGYYSSHHLRLQRSPTKARRTTARRLE